MLEIAVSGHGVGRREIGGTLIEGYIEPALSDVSRPNSASRQVGSAAMMDRIPERSDHDVARDRDATFTQAHWTPFAVPLYAGV